MSNLISIATESQKFESMQYMKIYNNQNKVPLPKGVRPGKGNIVFLLTPNQNESINCINSDFFSFIQSRYKVYYIDRVYRTKIGYKKVVENNTELFKKFYDDNNISSLKLLSPTQMNTRLKAEENMIIDLGYWIKLYFLYSKKSNSYHIASSFISFLNELLNSDEYSLYNKTIYLPIDKWIHSPKIKFSTKDDLTNPLSILLYLGKFHQELLSPLEDAKIILHHEKQVLVIPISMFRKNNIQKLLSTLSKFKDLEIRDTEIIDGESEKLSIMKDAVMNIVKRNLVGENNDITELIDDDDDMNILVYDDADQDDVEILSQAEDYLQSNISEEELNNSDPVDIAKQIEEYVKDRVYIRSIVPERTEKQKDLIEKLSVDSKKILRKSTISDLKSKTIDESYFDDCIESNNTSILKSKYVNFDKNYMEKKFESDIDSVIRALEDAEYPLFCVEKTVKDTSDQLNLKYTYTYKLKDMDGKPHTISLDIPRIIDGNYIYLQGSKKIIGHQIVLKPIVKTGADEVQLVSWYNKIFLNRVKTDISESSILTKYLLKNDAKYKVRIGNSIMKNSKYLTPIDFDALSKKIYEFKIGDNEFLLELDKVIELCKKNNIDISQVDKQDLIVGYNIKDKTPIVIKPGELYASKVISMLSEKEQAAVRKIKIGKANAYVTAKLNKQKIPIILFLAYCEGFKSVMKKAEVEYLYIPSDNAKELKNYPQHEWATITLSDGYIVWKRNPLKNSLLLNGLQSIPMENFSYEELESKNTWYLLMSTYFKNKQFSVFVDQFKDFMIDDCMREILLDFNLPTDLVSLMLYGVNLLTSNYYSAENDMNNGRIRSTEIIPLIGYKEVTRAYLNYRKVAYKGKGKGFSVRQNAIIQSLLSGSSDKIVDKAASKLVEEVSSLNPVLTLEKGRAVTYKGSTGINMERALQLKQRSYDESMLGILAMTTSDDPNTGIVRQMSLEPNITSTRGYMKITGQEHVNELNTAQLLSPSEMLTPFGVQHDDPCRTSMTYKQSKYMLMVHDSDPVIIGNRVESIIPYHLPDEFSIVAKDAGTVVESSKDFIVIKYKSGEYRTIDMSPSVKKNAASGFWILSEFETDLKKGDKIKKGRILAWDKRAFKRNTEDDGVSMKLGVFTKVCIAPSWDIFEDSSPVTSSLSRRMSVDMVDEKKVALSKTTYVDKIVKIGDKIKAGEILMRFDESKESDEFMNDFLKGLREDLKEEVLESTSTVIKSKHTGEIIDIKVYTSVPTDQLDPSLAKIVEEYHDKLRSKEEVYNEYRNPGDGTYYKSGSIVTEIPEIIKIDERSKLKGKKLDKGEGVVICFYIKYTDGVKKGDKICAEFALKGVVSHVIEEGFEPYSELHPEEEIGYIISPLAISARKVPSVFIAMFGNKCLVETKRQNLEIFNSNKPLSVKRKEIENKLFTVMSILDPSGVNEKYYRKKYKNMSDKEFEALYIQFNQNPKLNYYLEIVEFERDLKIEYAEKCAEYLNIPLWEYVALPYINGSKEDAVITPLPVPVGYINMKRMQQTLLKKTHGSISIDKRNPKTGQVIGEDKGARNSDCDTYSLLAHGAMYALKEFMGFRSDDMESKREAYNYINQNGYVSLEDLSNDPMNRVSLRTLHTHFLMQGIMTNIMKPDKDASEAMTVRPITDKMILNAGLKQVTNQLWFARDHIVTDDGLFSNEIFGSTQSERMSTSAYIDLKVKVFHPFFYEILRRLFPNKIDRLASGEGAWVINNGSLEEITDQSSPLYDEDATGIQWLVKNFRKIKIDKTGSAVREKRISLFNEFTDDEIFISKWVVIPIFYRDFDESSGQVSIPEINYEYRKLIRYSNAINPGELAYVNNQAIYNMQISLVALRTYGQSLIKGKRGDIHQSVMGKSIDYGCRGVISVPLMDNQESSLDMQVDALHSGIPLALCLSLGKPFIIRWVVEFFRSRLENTKSIPVLRKKDDGTYEMIYSKLSNQLDKFTSKDIEKHMEEYMNSIGTRFSTIPLKLENGEEVCMAFTGSSYSKSPNDPGASSISTRPLTWTDVFFMAAMETLTDKHVYITRYPMVDYYNIYPCGVTPVSTTKTTRCVVDGVVYQNYPVIDITKSESEISTMFIDTIQISNIFLDAIGGDYDGDTVSVRMVYSLEANKEAAQFIRHMKLYVHNSGAYNRKIGNEPYLTFFNMTKQAA